MNRSEQRPAQGAVIDLNQLVEPLASYISATGRPLVTLAAALAILAAELQKTHDAAVTQIAAFGSRRATLPESQPETG